MCFSCDEIFYSNHRCKNRMMGMSSHGEEQESNETQNFSDNIEEDELEVSLNTFSNFAHFSHLSYDGKENVRSSY
jgi:hypothetical protein